MPLTLIRVAVVIFVAASTLAAQDWNQWRGPLRSGVTSTFEPPRQWPDRPTRAWQVKVGSGHASPVVSEGRVFQFSREGAEEVATAFDLRSGRQVWQQRYDAAYRVNPAAASHGAGPKSTPVAAVGRLFTFGINGTLSAFDTSSGKVLWRKQYTQFDTTAPDFGVAMSPSADAGQLIAHVGGNTSGALVALDAATGAERWAWKGEGPAYASPVMATFGRTRQVVTQSRSAVVGVSASDGRLLWRIPFTTEYAQNIVTPLVVGDLVVYSGIEQPLTAARVTLDAGKWRTETIWQNSELPLYMSSPILAEGAVYGLTHRNKGQFFAADVETGKTLWTTRGREGDNAALIVAGGVLMATTTEGELIVLRAAAAKPEIIRRYTVAESPVWAHPVPAGRGILIKDDETLAYWTF